MKKRDLKEFANKSIDELRKSLNDSRKELFTIKMDVSLGKIKNTRTLFWKRKEIAYILTQLRRKELANG